MKKQNSSGKNLVKDKGKEKKFIILFAIIALLSGWIGLFIDTLIPDQVDEQTLGMGIWLILPFLCGIVIRLFRRDWKDIGIKPSMKSNMKWYGLAVFVFPALTFVFTLIAWIFGLVSFSDFSIKTIGTLIISMVIALFIKNIFEDFAWQNACVFH